MEEHDVAFLHLEVHSLVGVLVVVVDSEVGLVDLSLPLGVDVLQEFALVGLREHVQGPVLLGRVLEGSPGGNDPVGRSEGEVRQVLVERVPGTGPHVGRLIDKHGVDRFDVGSTEALEVGGEIRITTVGEELLIEVKILDFRNSGLAI